MCGTEEITARLRVGFGTRRRTASARRFRGTTVPYRLRVAGLQLQARGVGVLVGRGRCFAARADGAAEATGELLGRISHAKEARELQPELPRAAQHLGWCGWCGCGWCGLGWVRWSEGVGVEGCEAEVRYRLVRQYMVDAVTLTLT